MLQSVPIIYRSGFNDTDWPYDSPVAGSYDVKNTSTKLIILNNRHGKVWILIGFVDLLECLICFVIKYTLSIHADHKVSTYMYNIPLHYNLTLNLWISIFWDTCSPEKEKHLVVYCMHHSGYKWKVYNYAGQPHFLPFFLVSNVANTDQICWLTIWTYHSNTSIHNSRKLEEKKQENYIDICLATILYPWVLAITLQVYYPKDWGKVR